MLHYGMRSEVLDRTEAVTGGILYVAENGRKMPFKVIERGDTAYFSLALHHQECPFWGDESNTGTTSHQLSTRQQMHQVSGRFLCKQIKGLADSKLHPNL